MAISDIRDMINQENASDLTNKEIKSFLIDELGDTISFCQPERKNQSQFVFSSSIDVNHVVNSLRNLNVIKEAAITIRKSLLEVNFGLDDSFCDAQQLKQSWRETKIPSSLVTFFSALFNISSTKLMKSETSPEIDNDVLDNPEDEDEDNTEISDSLLMTKAKSLFQILHYHVSGGRQKTPVHVMNAHAIYERCRSRELITSFNRQSTCISYKSMKLLRQNLAKYTILESLNDKVPLPSHFDANNFTLAAMDNFDNADRNSLSGTMHAHDTAMTLFQIKPISHPEKPPKSTFDLSNAPDLHELPCQKIIPFHATHKLPLAESIKVAKDLFVDHSFKDSFSKSEFVINATQSIATDSQEVFIPSWAGFQSLISDKKLPKMHVGFVPFLPKPVTEYSTVYTAMKNFTHLAETLNQEALPLFCDEGVFRIVIDIYLNEPDQFSTLIPMLGGFHAAKCLQHCIGKFIKGSGLEESLRQTRFFGIKIVDSVLEGSHYVRSLKGLLILANAIEKLKWEAFIKTGRVENTGAFDDDMKSLLAALETSKPKVCREKCLDQSDFIHSEYEAFTKHC